jgi:hypothetical protein
MLAGMLLLAMDAQHTSLAIRHSQAYLAKRAAMAGANAAARNHTRALRRQQPAVPAPPTTLSAAVSRYPPNIISVFKQMRRQEEEATDASAPELPPEAETAYKQCDTRYGSMAFRTIKPRPEAGSGLDVVFIHGVCASSYMLRYIHTERDQYTDSLSLSLSLSLARSLSQLGTDGTNCQPPPRAVDRRRWLIVDLLGHGRSALSSDPWAYTMENQAKAVMDVLLAEGVRKMALIAHSLGGVVAVRLVSKFSKSFI